MTLTQRLGGAMGSMRWAALALSLLLWTCPAGGYDLVHDPLTSADPFNPDAVSSVFNDRPLPTERDFQGRFLYLDTVDTHPYLSYFSLGGRPCGYMYVSAPEHLPRSGTTIRLSADTDATFSVIQTQLLGTPVLGSGLSSSTGRVYAYICAADGIAKRLSAARGDWTYSAVNSAAYGSPLFSDTGVLAPPRFLELPAVHERVDDAPCADRADWRSLDGTLRCGDYTGVGPNRGNNFCGDEGYIDPALTNTGPTNSTVILWGIPAYQGCPSACGSCRRCFPGDLTPALAAALLATDATVARDTLASWSNWAPVGCVFAGECPALEGFPTISSGVIVPAAAGVAVWPANNVPDVGFVALVLKLGYTCELTRVAARAVEEGRELVVQEGFVSDGALSMRIFSANQMSEVRYTLDGSTPSHAHGFALPSGGVLTLRRSAKVRAIAVLMSEARVTARQSRVVELPMIAIRLSAPRFSVVSVGHYAGANVAAQAECARDGSDGFVTIATHTGQRTLRSNGCPRYTWGTDDRGNIARHHPWAFVLALNPVMLQRALPLLGLGGVVGVATDGVPFFAPPPSPTDAAFILESSLRDSCGGLALSLVAGATEGGASVIETKVHGMYHYRAAPKCWTPPLESDGHSGVVGWMLDGIPIYGSKDIGGSSPSGLDECGGHTDRGRPYYHYHASNSFPFLPGCLRGCVEPSDIMPLNPYLAEAAARVGCGRATRQFSYASLRGYTGGFASGGDGAGGGDAAAVERALEMAGNHTGSVALDVVCPETPDGLATLRYTLDGSDPLIGGGGGGGGGDTEGSGQHTAYGAVHLVLGNTSVVTALCEAVGVLSSGVASSGTITVEPVAYNPTWGETAGFWNLTNAGAFRGVYARERRAVQGRCEETYATRVSPVGAPGLVTPLGDLDIAVPACTAEYPGWDASAQPTLSHAVAVRDGVSGVVFDGAVLPLGMQLKDTVGDLVSQRRLPRAKLSVELWVNLDAPAPGARSGGGLVGAVLRSPGFLGKGWYLAYEMDASADMAVQRTATLVFALATVGGDQEGRGGLVELRTSLPLLSLANQWAHIVATYDGTHIALYLNGELAADPLRACVAGACGDVAYPVPDGVYVQSEVRVTVGVVKLHLEDLNMRGSLALLRILHSALSPAQVAAGATRLAIGLRVERCTPGSAGAYEGLAPCAECAPGTFTSLAGEATCVACAAGFFASNAGSVLCAQCEGGVLTPHLGATSADQCTGPDWCATAFHNCHFAAVCIPTAGSFECACGSGYVGDGTGCEVVCGDGARVEGEDCDDGDVFPSDGCNASCRVEPGFECAPIAGAGGRDACACKLSDGECCVRSYGRCLAERGRECQGCFEDFSDCLKSLYVFARTEINIWGAPVEVLDYNPPAAEVDAVAWANTEGALCDPALLKACNIGFSACERHAESLGGGGGCSAVGSSGGSSAGSCLGSYGDCMRYVACVPSTNASVADYFNVVSPS